MHDRKEVYPCPNCNNADVLTFDRWCNTWVCEDCGWHLGPFPCANCGYPDDETTNLPRSHKEAKERGWPIYRAIAQNRNRETLAIYEQAWAPDIAPRCAIERMRFYGYCGNKDATYVRVTRMVFADYQTKKAC